MGDRWAVGVQTVPRNPRVPLNSRTYSDLGVAISEFMDEVKRSLKYVQATPDENTAHGDLYREFITDEERTWDEFYAYLTGDFGMKPEQNVIKAPVGSDCCTWLHWISRVKA
jgi:hypothetical protein